MSLTKGAGKTVAVVAVGVIAGDVDHLRGMGADRTGEGIWLMKWGFGIWGARCYSSEKMREDGAEMEEAAEEGSGREDAAEEEVGSDQTDP